MVADPGKLFPAPGRRVRLLVHLLGDGPEPFRGFGVERVGGNPGGVGAGSGRVVGGVFLAVLEVPADNLKHFKSSGRACG